MELWKDIIDFDGYQVSSYGRVMSYKQCKSGKILKNRINDRGYSLVSLRKNGKKYFKSVHRLVLENFNPVENMSQLEVNHKDENKQNNNLDNLEWMTHKQNINYGTAKTRRSVALSEKIICIDTGIVYDSMRMASEITGINYGNISSVCNHRIKTAGGYRWEKYTNNQN